MATFPVKQTIAGLANGATGRVVVHTLDTSNTFVVVGNNSVSNLAVGSENVASAVITKLFWTGNVQVSRGTTLLFTASTGTAGFFDFATNDAVLNQNATVNIVTNVAAGGFLLFETKKKLV